MGDDQKSKLIAAAICEASASWIVEPLHEMAYEDMARAAIAATPKQEKRGMMQMIGQWLGRCPDCRRGTMALFGRPGWRPVGSAKYVITD